MKQKKIPLWCVLAHAFGCSASRMRTTTAVPMRPLFPASAPKPPEPPDELERSWADPSSQLSVKSGRSVKVVVVMPFHIFLPGRTRRRGGGSEGKEPVFRSYFSPLSPSTQPRGRFPRGVFTPDSGPKTKPNSSGPNRVSHGTSFLPPGSLARRRLARVIRHHQAQTANSWEVDRYE